MNICRVAYLEVRCINSIQNLLSVDAVKTLVYSLVLSCLGYCNSLLIGLSQYHIRRLQGVQNAAARSILRTSRSDNISPLLRNLHCSPINGRIVRKVVMHHNLALDFNTCLKLLMFTPLLDPCSLRQKLVS